MKRNRIKHRISVFIRYLLTTAIGIIMIYPLVWMFGATFKTNNEIFSSLLPFTKSPTFDGYKNALNNYGGEINLFRSMLNTYCFVLPKVLFTLFSCTVTAYGFSRFSFKGKKLLFALLIATLFIPQTVMNVPQFIMYNKLGWIDSPLYLPLVVPSMFAFDTYFVFMLVQFFRGIPKELDEASVIDGCNTFQTLLHIIVPVLKPALISCALFQFMWSSNDFTGPLLYVNTPSRYPASIFVKLSMDADTGFQWNRVLAVSFISVIPSIIIFFFAQNKFTDSITAGSIKE